MIQRIRWSRLAGGELSSPFLRGEHERPLRITFHTSTLNSLSADESTAMETLLELSQLLDIYALQTGPGRFPQIKIWERALWRDNIPVSVDDKDSGYYREGGIYDPQQWPRIAMSLTKQFDPEHPETKAMLDDLLVARAHCALYQDILVTLSPRLLGHCDEEMIRQANPLSPTEAVKVFGLFLRSRGNYTYRIQGKVTWKFDRGLFYEILVRQRLPNMWRYFSACVHAEKVRGDDTGSLGQSILERCIRAIQARDAIGEQFYVPQNNETRDTMMYHFDYLTLLLAGALDAQARIAHRTYRISKPKEWDVSFRQSSQQGKKFLESLRRSGAADLCQLLSKQETQDVMTLLYTLRNTIHGSNLPTLAYQRSPYPQESFVEIPPEHKGALWEATKNCGSPDTWGLVHIQKQEILFEPYSFSVMLIAKCLELINDLAAATDVSGLFPSGYAMPSLLDGPPEDETFNEENRKRVAVLG